MNRKEKGNRNERRSRDLMKIWGYTVTKSGGSFGAFDLVGIRYDNILLVQSKTNERPNDKELWDILRFECPPESVKQVHIWVDRQKEPLILNERYIRRILNDEPLETDVVRRGNNLREWYKNRNKAKNRSKQPKSKRRVGKTRADDTKTTRKRKG